VLRQESKMLAAREIYWVRRAQASSLRSNGETARLRQLAPTARVFCMPVSVTIPPEPAHDLAKRPMAAVFTGGLSYQPNLEALRVYVSQIIPEFERRKVAIPSLNVIGMAPDALQKGVRHHTIRFLGYVPDVNEEVQKAQVFFAPIVSGTGIKIKVLEAMACGVPVIALPVGLSGLHGTPGQHYLQANDATDFVAQYERLRDDDALARSIAASGRELAVMYYSLDAATRILGDALESIR
jgi:glycosyltransferase involved in cell wall biosynthesis